MGGIFFCWRLPYLVHVHVHARTTLPKAIVRHSPKRSSAAARGLTDTDCLTDCLCMDTSRARVRDVLRDVQVCWERNEVLIEGITDSRFSSRWQVKLLLQLQGARL